MRDGFRGGSKGTLDQGQFRGDGGGLIGNQRHVIPSVRVAIIIWVQEEPAVGPN